MSIEVNVETFAGIPARDTVDLGDMLKDLLSKADSPVGNYRVKLVRKGTGSAQQQGVARVKIRGIEKTGCINIRAQAGGNHTCFDMFLYPPQGVDSKTLRAELTDTVAQLRRGVKVSGQDSTQQDNVEAKIQLLCALSGGAPLKADQFTADLVKRCGWQTTKSARDDLKECTKFVRVSKSGTITFLESLVSQQFPAGIPLHAMATPAQIDKAKSVLLPRMTPTLQITMDLLADPDNSKQLTRISGRIRKCAWVVKKAVFEMLDDHEREPIVGTLIEAGLLAVDTATRSNGSTEYTLHTLLLDEAMAFEPLTLDAPSSQEVESDNDSTAVKDDKQVLEDRLAALKAEIDRLNSARDQINEERSGEYEKVREAKADVANKELALKKARAEAERVEGRYNLVGGKINRINKQIAQAQEQFDQASAQFAALNAKKVDEMLEHLRSTLTDAELAAFKDKIHTL